MLLQRFTGFDDVIIVCVTSQPQNFNFKNLTKNSFNMQKILLLSLTNRFLDRGQIPPPLGTNWV